MSSGEERTRARAAASQVRPALSGGSTTVARLSERGWGVVRRDDDGRTSDSGIRTSPSHHGMLGSLAESADGLPEGRHSLGGVGPGEVQLSAVSIGQSGIEQLEEHAQ